MIKPLTLLITATLFFSCQFIVLAQDDKANILIEPEGWRYEKIDFPLEFAPAIPFEGFEELRFAPGMFDTTSETYFTYLFAIRIDNKDKLNRDEVKNFLSRYYKGLCHAVASSKGLSVDTSKIEINIKRVTKVNRRTLAYSISVLFFDAFTNGQNVWLNMELEVIKNKRKKKSYMLALVSPQSDQSDVWKELFVAKEKIDIKALLN